MEHDSKRRRLDEEEEQEGETGGGIGGDGEANGHEYAEEGNGNNVDLDEDGVDGDNDNAEGSDDEEARDGHEEEQEEETSWPSHLDDFEIDLTAPQGYEYLDHTADVQLHTWGSTLQEALEQVVVAMFGYMTDLRLVDVDEECTTTVEAKGHDLPSLLFQLMDEFLFLFSTQYVVFKEVRITKLDLKAFAVTAVGKGEPFDLHKHPQGTEVKAITYSNMQIFTDLAPFGGVTIEAGDNVGIVRPLNRPDRHELYMIIDI